MLITQNVNFFSGWGCKGKGEVFFNTLMAYMCVLNVYGVKKLPFNH